MDDRANKKKIIVSHRIKTNRYSLDVISTWKVGEVCKQTDFFIMIWRHNNAMWQSLTLITLLTINFFFFFFNLKITAIRQFCFTAESLYAVINTTINIVKLEDGSRCTNQAKWGSSKWPTADCLHLGWWTKAGQEPILPPKVSWKHTAAWSSE